MYIKNDICYAGELEPEIKIKAAKTLPGKMMLITFSTGEQRLFDATLLTGTAFKPLEDENVFASFKIFHGFLTWNNGEIDIAPEAVYKKSYAYTPALI